MDFPISGVHIDPLYLIGVGFIVGVLGGFFGVGGSFLAGPALFAFGVPMNFVVGTDLTHIVGKSIVAAKKHRVLGNVDLKLGAIMVIGTIAGVEVGAQFIQYLKDRAEIDLVVGIAFVLILVTISGFMLIESIKTIRMRREKAERDEEHDHDESAFAHVAQWVHKWKLPPCVDLPVSGLRNVSLWSIVIIAFVGGFFSGFLGGGAGYIRMPAMVYLLGIPTHVAVGTDLFEIMISAGYGTLSHAYKGNVDILIALVMHTGAAIGAQIGATCTEYFEGTKIRLAFIPLPLIGAGIVIYNLMRGVHH